MAARVSARLTASQGRRFGLTVGLAFVVLAALTAWRDVRILPFVLGSIGGTLLVAAMLVPSHLGPVERAWMALAHAISRVTTPIIMAVMYFAVITPTAVARRSFGGNPLAHAAGSTGFWKPRPPDARRSKSMERQF